MKPLRSFLVRLEISEVKELVVTAANCFKAEEKALAIMNSRERPDRPEWKVMTADGRNDVTEVEVG